MITRAELLNLMGEFTWFWDCTFFISTKRGNFVWSDPDYPGGDNTIRPFAGSIFVFQKEHRLDYGRDKGYHQIYRKCGDQIIFITGDTDMAQMNNLETISGQLADAGYDHAVAIATDAEVSAGAACGQLSIITEQAEN